MKISYTALLLIFLYPHHSYAQTPQVQHKIDSLLVLTKHEKDADKLSNYFLEISQKYNAFDRIKSLNYAKQAHTYIINSENDTLKIYVLNVLGIAYYQIDDYANAFLFYKKALALEKKINDKKGQAKTMANIASLYNVSDDPITSQKYLKKAYHLIEQNSILDKILITIMYQTMGSNWKKLDRLDSAEKYYHVSLNFALKNELRYYLISGYFEIAELYFRKEDYKSCAKYLRLMHETEAEQNDYWMDGTRLHLSAQLDFIAGNAKLAEKKSLGAVQLGKKNDYMEVVESAYAFLGEIKEKSNQFDSALYYNKLSQLYRDSLKGSAVKNLLQFADTEMEEEESARLDLEIKNQRKTLALLTGGVVMLAILLGVTYNFLRREKILKSNIEIKNKEINEQNLKLLTQTNEMSSLMSEMEKILKEKSSQLNNYAFYNSHRLRAPIARIVGLGKLGKITPTPEEKLFISSKICEVTEELDAMSKEGQRLLDES